MRALAVDPRNPQRVYLGTTDGHIFGSTDGGERWELLGRAGETRDGVVTTILVDPRAGRVLYGSLWTLDPTRGGGVFRSDDGGRTWSATALVGQPVRALAQAPSDPEVLAAGTLDGVYRSNDGGNTWHRISPLDHEEIRNLDSLAFDPENPDILYAGTYHLPWKTENGGRSWFPIQKGMLDDSDVMSILVDRVNPQRVFASACSGIYRSDNAGRLWRKIQGIPFSARRTHVIRQHLLNPDVVYAGTTEGLWKTSDGGDTWRRMTPRDWVINAVELDPRGSDRVVMGTERLGVLVSDDGAASFRAANDGFTHRQILAVALDRTRPGRVLAVLANSPMPALATEDGGFTWSPLGPGLETEKLLRVYATPARADGSGAGWLMALDGGGLLRYDAERHRWLRAGKLLASEDELLGEKKRRRASPGPQWLEARVEDMAFAREADGGGVWYAATPASLLKSRDRGDTWTVQPLGPVTLPSRSVRVSPDGKKLWVVSMRGIVFSPDAGKTWTWHDLPFEAGGALRLDVAPDGTLIAAAPRGLYISRDGGKIWQPTAAGLPETLLQDLAIVGETYLAAMQTGGLFVSRDAGRNWERVEGLLSEGRFPMITTTEAGDVVFAASSTEGLYAVDVGPAQEKQAEAAGNGNGPREKK